MPESNFENKVSAIVPTESGEPPASSILNSERQSWFAGIAVIAVLSFIVYYPSLNGGFIFDDNDLLTNNALVQSDDGLSRFWFSMQPVDYWPISNSSFWFEWRLWHLHPGGYHTTNLILHVLCCAMLWRILRALSVPGAFFAALLFAVHPVNVESVAWIAQRKNVLSLLFFLASAYYYIRMELDREEGEERRFLPHGTSRWYCWSVFWFLAAMLSKSSVAVLPLVLLTVVAWRRKWVWCDFGRMMPFLVIAVALTSVNIAFAVHHRGEVIRDAGFLERLLGAGAVVWFYLYKAVCPLYLCFIYPQWTIETKSFLWWIPLVSCLAVTFMLWKYRKTWGRPFLFAWSYFCIALIPAMGFVDVGYMKISLVADHYQHIALIGVVTLAAAAWAVHMQSSDRGAIVVWGNIIAAGLLVSLAGMSWLQNGLYENAFVLYRDVLEKNPRCWLACNNLAVEFESTGQTSEAMKYYGKAVEFRPDYFMAENNWGTALYKQGKADEAIKHFQRAVEIKEDYPEAHNNLGTVYANANRLPEAIVEFEKALKYKPEYYSALSNLALAYQLVKQHDKSIALYKDVLKINPSDANAHYNLGLTLKDSGRSADALESFGKTIQIQPGHIDAYMQTASIYTDMKRHADAFATAQKAMAIAKRTGDAAQVQAIQQWINANRRGNSQ